jgi:hypothetical protein
MSTSSKIFVFLICALALAGRAQDAWSRYKQASQEKASTQGGKSDVDKADKTSRSCIFDFEVGEISNCLSQTAQGRLFVASKVLKQLRFDSYGLATVLSLKEGWMYLNRRGMVVVRGVPTMDNGPDAFHDGLVRVVRNKKYGFANRSGQLVIPPIYDGALNFEKGKAKVCKECESKCADGDCEHHFFSGGEWLQIDTHGNTVARIQPDN